jgi:hypothetical protein
MEKLTNYKAALATLTTLEIEALRSAFRSSEGNGHDFGFTDEITIPGQSKQAVGALISSLIKKELIVRDSEFGQFAFGDFGNAAMDGEFATAVEAFLTPSTVATPPSPIASTLDALRAIAAPMFTDPAVVSVNVQASFGIVTVYRDGQIITQD